MATVPSADRRRDHVTALHVHQGISISHLTSAAEAIRAMVVAGVPQHVITRVTSGFEMQRRRDSRSIWPGTDRRQQTAEQ